MELFPDGEKELEVIKKLFDDGLLTKEEYEDTRDLLIEKDSNRVIQKREKLKPFELNIKPRGNPTCPAPPIIEIFLSLFIKKSYYNI